VGGEHVVEGRLHRRARCRHARRRFAAGCRVEGVAHGARRGGGRRAPLGRHGRRQLAKRLGLLGQLQLPPELLRSLVAAAVQPRVKLPLLGLESGTLRRHIVGCLCQRQLTTSAARIDTKKTTKNKNK
jgi:hypothetical protein